MNSSFRRLECVALLAGSIGGSLFVATLPARAQETAAPERITVPFRNPSGAKNVKVDLLTGSLTVSGYDGAEVVIEYTLRDGLRPLRGKNSAPPPGMHRLNQPVNDVEATEDNNTVKITSGHLGAVDLSIKVPRQAAVNLHALNGRVSVDGIAGEIEVEALNGSIKVGDSTGAVLAHSMNGKITASLTKASADKPSSFSTMNGEIEVTLPADLKARLKMKTDHGEIFTDFDVKTDIAAPAPQVDDQRKNGGALRIRPDQTINGTINGGGPEMQFTTYNGRIVIRKR